MKKNIGTTDRLIRLGLAIILLIVAFQYSSVIALIAALFVLFEVLFSWCALFALLGKSSCPIDQKKEK